jgi:DNA-binding Lrp family transcriptional regulator
VQESDVLECHHVTGDESFILKVKTANTASLEKLLGEIHSMEGLTQTVTQVVLSTPKETQILEVDHEGDLDLECEAKRGENIQERKRVAETSRAK